MGLSLVQLFTTWRKKWI